NMRCLFIRAIKTLWTASGLLSSRSVFRALCFFIPLSTAHAASAKPPSYKDIQAQITKAIAAENSRVWLYSEFLGDSDLAMILILAKFRGLDVRVVLNESFAGHYASQQLLLKRDGVLIATVRDTPSFLKPFGKSMLVFEHKFITLPFLLDPRFAEKSLGHIHE